MFAIGILKTLLERISVELWNLQKEVTGILLVFYGEKKHGIIGTLRRPLQN